MRSGLCDDLSSLLPRCSLGSSAFAADEGQLSGYVVKLAEKTNLAQPQSVNVGGLVIVVVRDSGSRPPQDVSVVAPDRSNSSASSAACRTTRASP